MEKELLSSLFKTEYSKIIAVLCKCFGIANIAIAEDIANDSFLKATEAWSMHGVPENPTAWLYTVAKNKTKDYVKRQNLFSVIITKELQNRVTDYDEIELDLSVQNIRDSQLQMIFTVCNPVIPPEAQIGLALRILCGFGIDTIADAFLTNKETIHKRLLRAKEKLREANLQIALPAPGELNARLGMVLRTIYLIFNEGYYSATPNNILRKELCLEAMRLNYFLLENASTNTPGVNALMSLMCFHASRLDARTNATGEIILYEDQNRALWDDELIAKGNVFLIESAKGQEITKYHLEASIAYWHCTKNEPANKWEKILQLYNQLLQIEYSPVAALNRTFALYKTSGKENAIKEAEKIQLEGNHFYHALLGYLYTGMDKIKAMAHYQKALLLAKSEKEKIILQNHINQL